MISKACKYGIRAAVYIASKADEGVKLNVKEIAQEVDAPEAFTAKVLQVLNKNRVITSLKGPYGGFFIEAYQLDQPVINIVNAIDGMTLFRECGMGLKNCSAKHPCPMHHKFVSIRNELQQVFQETTIRHLATELNEGTAYIKNLTAEG